MSKFIDGQIIFNEEEKEMFKECATFLNNPPSSRKSMTPNLIQALEEGFAGWTVRPKETEKINEAKEADKADQLTRIEKALAQLSYRVEFLISLQHK